MLHTSIAYSAISDLQLLMLFC